MDKKAQEGVESHKREIKHFCDKQAEKEPLKGLRVTGPKAALLGQNSHQDNKMKTEGVQKGGEREDDDSFKRSPSLSPSPLQGRMSFQYPKKKKSRLP